MVRRISTLLFCLLTAATLGYSETETTTPAPRVPKGLYTNFLLDGLYADAQTVTAASVRPEALPRKPEVATTPLPADTALIQYLVTLLDNPAISGLAPMIPWSLLNPKSPGSNPASPLPGAYNWSPLDDVFIAVDEWNESHPDLPPKTIQLIVSAGFNSPPWVFDDIDAGVCGTGTRPATCTGSCDGLFMTPPPLTPVSSKCGYTTLFYRVESNPVEQLPLPMPWNAAYKADWQAFLVALNKQVLQEPAAPAFVSIAMAGPTASSAEMILPNQIDQAPYETGGVLALKSGPKGVVPPGEKAVGFTVPDAWNALFGKHYGSSPGYQNSDQAFIDEWDNVIDVYGKTFSGVTLVLTSTAGGLPSFTTTDTALLEPAAGFGSDCDEPTTSAKAMPCAAVTQVLVHLTNPTVGGNNAKSVFEAGMTAIHDNVDLTTNGVKWLGYITADGTNPLPGTTHDMSKMLGGIQFAHTFSPAADIQSEGCPTYPKTDCPGLTPSVALYNVLSLSYFPGTEAGPVWDASESVGFAHFQYTNAPINFLEIYSTDILYASGLGNCPFKDISGNPAENIPPNVSPCENLPSNPSFPDVQATQEELELTNLLIHAIAEPSDLP
jgi:hypothetical protein